MRISADVTFHLSLFITRADADGLSTNASWLFAAVAAQHAAAQLACIMVAVGPVALFMIHVPHPFIMLHIRSACYELNA